MDRYVVLPFWLAGQHFAVALDNVVRVLPALLSTSLPGAPATVRGLVNVQGQVLPVIDLARRFDWPSAPTTLWQPFIWLQTSKRQLLLPVEKVAAVCSCVASDFSPAPDPHVPSSLLQGVLRSAEGMLLIQDVEQLLCAAEESQLDAALAEQGGDHDARV